MSEYQVIARKYRPKSFSQVIGQEAVVRTLQNAIKQERLAHAYLFCGPRGTGKTTLARAFAKALNCLNPGKNHEPCNKCSFCKEIAAGNSLDVIEIDGASHRGIDDIRQINDTVAYSASSGKYKIYIIDEVHMLTKEAFNALLKTLEEPPPKVKFFFATTEPHKVLPTILSRCQRFNLNRIPPEKIVEKLQMITQDLGVKIEEEALHLIAKRADGGLRDAESLLDQVLSFHEGDVTLKSVADILGVMAQDVYFDLDRAGKEGNLSFAFEVAKQIFEEGKDIAHFLDGLAEHFRNILEIKLLGAIPESLSLTDQAQKQYQVSSSYYRQDQCLELLEYLLEAQQRLRSAPTGRIALESTLLHVLQTHYRLPIEFLVQRLCELEKSLVSAADSSLPEPQQVSFPTINNSPIKTTLDTHAELSPKQKGEEPPITVDTSAQKKSLNSKVPLHKEVIKPKSPSTPLDKETQSRYDTLFQFAAVELEGQLKKHT